MYVPHVEICVVFFLYCGSPNTQPLHGTVPVVVTTTPMMTDSSTLMTTMVIDASTTMTMMMTDSSTSMTTMMTDGSTFTTTMTDSSTSMTTMITDGSTSTTTMTDSSTSIATMVDASTSMTTTTDGSTMVMMTDASSIMMTMTDASATMTTMVTEPSTTMSLEVTVVFVITFQSDFSNELEDRTSPAFMNLANAICARFIQLFRVFTNADIVCVVARFRSGSVLADVDITVPANNSADAQGIESNALNITNMDFGNVTTNNQTYVTTAVNSNATVQETTSVSTTMAATTDMITPSSPIAASGAESTAMATTMLGTTPPSTTTTGVDTTPESTTPMATPTQGTMSSSTVAPVNQSTDTSTQAGVPETTPAATLVTRRVRISLTANQRNGQPLEYTNDLADPNSAAFRDLEEVFCGAVREYLNRTRGSILRSYACVVSVFSPGSVVADMQIDVGADNVDDLTTLADTTEAISTMNAELPFGNGSINVVYQPGGLSTGAIVAIVLGVIVGLLLIIVCSCCILVQMASRNNAAKLALGDAYHGPYARDSPVFFGDDPFDESHSYNSLDLREYAVGQAVERIARDRTRRNLNGHEHFRTPYVVGQDEAGSVERNPIYY